MVFFKIFNGFFNFLFDACLGRAGRHDEIFAGKAWAQYSKESERECGREIFRNEGHASSHIEHRETNTHKIDLLHYVLQL